jgi:PAS domain-containing protein
LIQPDERDRKIAALRDRLSKLTEASLRINESLDVEAARHGAMEGGRAVTRAPYSLNTTLDASGQVEDYLILGMNSDDAERLWQAPEGPKFFEYLNALSGSLRGGELEDFTRSIGLLEFRSPVTFTALMGAPILHRRARVGNIYVGSDEPGREFTQEDEETLVLFASQAAQVIANARRHRDEQRARADLETLIDTSPVGVAVFDMRTGAAVSFNREGRRIVDGLRSPGQTPEDLLGLI